MRMLGDASEHNALVARYGSTPWTRAPGSTDVLLDLFLYDKARTGKSEAGDPLVSARIKVLAQSPWIDHLKKRHRWDSATSW